MSDPPRQCRSRFAPSAGSITILALTSWASAAQGQSIEPRAYSPAPVGVNFVIAGIAHTSGGLSFDSSIPITDAHLKTIGPIFAGARTLDLFGKSGKIDLIVPFARLQGSALYLGEPVEREVEGMADPLLRLSVMLHGAPAMTAAEFRSYRPDVIFGASVQVSAPLGQYDSSRLVNLGSNRWSIKPEVGVSKTFGPWTMEFQGAVTFFTTNDDFYGGNRRSQQPLFSAQVHTVYSFNSGIWASFDATYFTGGQTTLNGIEKRDLQRNWRLGATLAAPISRQHSLKLYASSGVSARTGNNYDLIGVAWQYRWGAGFTRK